MKSALEHWPISQLEIKNFKSIKHISFKPGRVNVFIGKPNSGKSNLLEAISALGSGINKSGIQKNQIRFTDIPSLFYDQNINSPIEITTNDFAIKIENRSKEGFELLYKIKSELIKAHEKEWHKQLSGDLDIDFFKTNKGYTYYLHPLTKAGKPTRYEKLYLPNSDIRKYQFKSIGKQTKSDADCLTVSGSNLWTIIRHNSNLKEFSSSFFKEFSLDVLFDVKQNRMDIMRRNEDTYYLIDFSMTPDTFQRMLYHLAAIESNKNCAILFEEPEAQSYPPYIQMLAERIIEDEFNQYFITTHSPFIVEKMLEMADSSKGIKFFVTHFKDYQTKLHELSRKEIKHITENSVDLFFNMDLFQE